MGSSFVPICLVSCSLEFSSCVVIPGWSPLWPVETCSPYAFRALCTSCYSLSLSFAFWHKKLFQAHPVCSFPNLQWVLFPRNSASLLWTWYFRKQDLSAGWVYASLEDSIASRISQQTTQSRARNQMSVCKCHLIAALLQVSISKITNSSPTPKLTLPFLLSVFVTAFPF